MGVGFGYFDVDSVNATKLVADLRAGRDTGFDSSSQSGYDPNSLDAWTYSHWEGIPGVSDPRRVGCCAL